METTELSKQTPDRIYDAIRKRWVVATPEEMVRQRLLYRMMGQLSYPRELISVEKSLSDLCVSRHMPSRRLDIVCFMKKKDSLLPLLIIECKENRQLAEGGWSQVEGYNALLQAPFTAMASPEGVCCCYVTKQGRVFLPFLPCYQDLVQAVER